MKLARRGPIATLTGTVALDDYEPVPRSWDVLHIEEWDHETNGRVLVVTHVLGRLKDANRAIYLMDDGRTVTPWYVAGWGGEGLAEGSIILHPFPTNYNADGTPRLRADDGRPVDFSNWQLGPRRAYHVKLSEEIAR